MSKRPSTTAQAVLGLLALRPAWSTWELAKQLRRNLRFFWPRAESRVYEAVRALERDGLATSTETFVGHRRRTTYAITPAGERAVRQWMSTPPRATALECDALLRIMLADLGTESDLLAALDQVRSDAMEILSVGAVVGPEYLAGTAPFQDDVHARALVFDFLSSYSLMLVGWADRAEVAIRAWANQDEAQKAAAAVAAVRARLKDYPRMPTDLPGGGHARDS